jgi:hypothetical protein
MLSICKTPLSAANCDEQAAGIPEILTDRMPLATGVTIQGALTRMAGDRQDAPVRSRTNLFRIYILACIMLLAMKNQNAVFWRWIRSRT